MNKKRKWEYLFCSFVLCMFMSFPANTAETETDDQIENSAIICEEEHVTLSEPAEGDAEGDSQPSADDESVPEAADISGDEGERKEENLQSIADKDENETAYTGNINESDEQEGLEGDVSVTQVSEESETTPDASGESEELEESETTPGASGESEELEESETTPDASEESEELEESETTPGVSGESEEGKDDIENAAGVKGLRVETAPGMENKPKNTSAGNVSAVSKNNKKQSELIGGSDCTVIGDHAYQLFYDTSRGTVEITDSGDYKVSKYSPTEMDKERGYGIIPVNLLDIDLQKNTSSVKAMDIKVTLDQDKMLPVYPDTFFIVDVHPDESFDRADDEYRYKVFFALIVSSEDLVIKDLVFHFQNPYLQDFIVEQGLYAKPIGTVGTSRCYIKSEWVLVNKNENTELFQSLSRADARFDTWITGEVDGKRYEFSVQWGEPNNERYWDGFFDNLGYGKRMFVYGMSGSEGSNGKNWDELMVNIDKDVVSSQEDSPFVFGERQSEHRAADVAKPDNIHTRTVNMEKQPAVITAPSWISLVKDSVGTVTEQSAVITAPSWTELVKNRFWTLKEIRIPLNLCSGELIDLCLKMGGELVPEKAYLSLPPYILLDFPMEKVLFRDQDIVGLSHAGEANYFRYSEGADHIDLLNGENIKIGAFDYIAENRQLTLKLQNGYSFVFTRGWRKNAEYHDKEEIEKVRSLLRQEIHFFDLKA